MMLEETTRSSAVGEARITATQMLAVGYFSFLFLVHLMILTVIIQTQSLFALLYYITGTIYGLGINFYLFSRGEEQKDVPKAIGITFLLLIALVVVFFFVMDSGDPLFFFAGFVPSFLFMLLKSFPYSITIRTEPLVDGLRLVKRTNYILSRTEITRDIPDGTKLKLHVEPQGLKTAFGYSNNYHTLYFEHISQIIDPIIFTPLKHRGLPLLSVLVEIFPEEFQIKTNSLDRSTGGLLSSLEQKAKSATVTTPISTEYGQNLTSSNLQTHLDDPHFRRIIMPKKSLLLLNIVWGVILTLFAVFAVVILVLLTYASYLRYPILSPSFLLFSLVSFSLLYISLNMFIFWSLTHLLGSYQVIENSEEVTLRLHFGPLRSNIYRFPKNLDPRIERSNGRLAIICRDDYGEYFHMTLGKFE